MAERRVALVYGDPSGEGPARLAAFLKAREGAFAPVIVGCEPIYTAALSRICPALIDRYPVYHVPVGRIVRGEADAASGRAFLETVEKLPGLWQRGIFDAALVLLPDDAALRAADARMTSLPRLWEHVFPGRTVRMQNYLTAQGAAYRMAGLPLPVVMAEAPESGWLLLDMLMKQVEQADNTDGFTDHSEESGEKRL